MSTVTRMAPNHLSRAPIGIVSSEPNVGSERFEHDADVVLKQIGRAMRRLLESLPPPIRGGGDVQRALKLDKILGWQLFRLGSVVDPVVVGPNIPRPAPMAKTLRAAAAKGVPAEVITEVREAFDEFERLVERHAGTRQAFDSMVRGLREDAPHISTKDRRTDYRANTAIWGTQVRTGYLLAISHPSEDGKFEDFLMVDGCVGLHKLRHGGIDLGMSRKTIVRTSTDDGMGAATPHERRNLDILDEFSTQPLPPLKMWEVEPGMIKAAFDAERVGRGGELTYFVRDIARNTGELPQPWWGAGFAIDVPTEMLVIDLLVPAGWSDPATATVDTHSNLLHRGPLRTDADRLPISESVSHFGDDLSLLRTPHVPRCCELVTQVLQDAGWAETRFDIYRSVVQYPILSSSVRVRVESRTPGMA